MFRIRMLFVVAALAGFGVFGADPPGSARGAETNPSLSTNAPAAPARPEANHSLAPGDVIEVKVYQEENLNAKSTVDNEGYVNLPLLQRVPVAGKNVEEATVLIRNLLKQDYLYNPQVSISLVEVARGHFAVLGQVGRPGTYEISSNEKVNLLQAIAMAGGFTRLANRKAVIVSRTSIDSASVDNKEEKLTVNAADLAKNKNAKPFWVKRGDTIIVPESAF